MHASSYRIMKRLIERIPRGSEPLSVLDVGSFDVNGTYRDLIPDAWSYVGLDIRSGPNVDVVVADPYNWAELNGRQFDLVISGQCLEHCEFPWLTANEMLCHLRVGGFAAVVAPFVQARHNHPHDYWRFLDSGLKALFCGRIDAVESGVAQGTKQIQDAWFLGRKSKV